MRQNLKSKRISSRETKGKIFILSGPSGSGKTTLSENILKDKKLSKKISRSISFTTRQKRSKEMNGRDYFFIKERQFKKYLKAKKILEWTKYLGYYYATPKGFVDKQLKANKNLLLCLDLKGALKIKKMYPGRTVLIFVKPPSVKDLHHRIANRCSKTKQIEIKRRLTRAKKELTCAHKYDFRLINDDLHLVTRKLKEIISQNLQ